MFSHHKGVHKCTGRILHYKYFTSYSKFYSTGKKCAKIKLFIESEFTSVFDFKILWKGPFIWWVGGGNWRNYSDSTYVKLIKDAC